MTATNSSTATNSCDSSDSSGSPTSSALLTCEDVTKRFGGIVALDGFRAEFRAGEITGVVGPNGAGKTTLFDVITGIHAPESGTVEFRGESVAGRPPHEVCRAGIARTFQSPRPIRNLSVEKNLRVAARFGAGADPDATSERRQRVLDALDLTDRRHDDAGDLQMVEQKYVDLARALLTDPELVLLDEILAGLTPGEKDGMIASLRELHADFDVDFLVVEHDLRAIRSLSDAVVAMDDGRFLASGTPEDVLGDERVREAYVGE